MQTSVVGQKFADTCDCSPITKDNLTFSNEVFYAPLFEVTPKSSAYKIIVVERPFYSQVEYGRLEKKYWDQFWRLSTETNPTPDETIRLLPGAMKYLFLPAWHYEKTGVDVQLRPTTTSPSPDSDTAYHVYSTILDMVSVYH